jgi:hypothetical protein
VEVPSDTACMIDTVDVYILAQLINILITHVNPHRLAIGGRWGKPSSAGGVESA